MKLLIVDSDPRSVKALDRALRDKYVMDVANTGEQAEHLAYNSHYDLVLMDLVLPDIDGEDLCQIFKSRFRNLPIIIISKRSLISDKELAFEKGADDFLPKPFSIRELRIRITALTRRLKPDRIGDVDSLHLGKLMIDRRKRIVTYKKKVISLRRKETLLLEFLIMNRGRVMTRGEILEHVWDNNISPFTNTVDVHIKRLRDKIETPFGESYITTVHGIGYLIE